MTPEFTLVETNDIRLRVAMAGQGPLVLLVHGFPESWYSWRHQIGPIAAAGFRVAAVDVRGYGGSDKPPAVADYDMLNMTRDMAGLVDALGAGERAVIAGHDWGAPIAWNTALLYPDKIRAVAGLSVPYTPPPARPLSEIFDAIFTQRNKFFYQVYFAEPGKAEADLEQDIRKFLRMFFYGLSGDSNPDETWPTDKPATARLLDGMIDPDPFPDWLSDADLDYYTGEFEHSGLRGPLNRYRNHERDHGFLLPYASSLIEQPALFIGGTRDLAMRLVPGADMIAIMRRFVPNLMEAIVLEGCGHWTQQERPAEVTEIMLRWLSALE